MKSEDMAEEQVDRQDTLTPALNKLGYQLKQAGDGIWVAVKKEGEAMKINETQISEIKVAQGGMPWSGIALSKEDARKLQSAYEDAAERSILDAFPDVDLLFAWDRRTDADLKVSFLDAERMLVQDPLSEREIERILGVVYEQICKRAGKILAE